MQKKYLFLSISGLVTAGVVLALSVSHGSTLAVTSGTTSWNHYEAVAATCNSYGIKEYWSDCKGTTTIVEPVGGEIIEKGQPSAADIQYIVDTYGTSDERLVPISDIHASGVESTECLGKQVCSVCGETLGSVIPTIDFSTNGIYGMYDWYLSFGAPDASWVTVPSATSIQFLTYNPGVLSEIQLPRIYFAGFDSVSIDLAMTYQNEVYSFDQVRATSFTVPSNSYAAKLVFSNISNSGMTATLCDSSNNILLSSTVVNADVMNGVEGFKFYAEGVYTGTGYEVLSNFTFLKDCVHNYSPDPNCIGKEVCSVCGKARGVASPAFDFTSNLYGAYDVYEPWGDYAQDGWAAAVNDTSLKFANYTAGGLCQFHMPKIYFAGYESLTVDITVQENLVIYSLDHGFTTSYQVSSPGYKLKLVFDSITSSSMTVKILDSSDAVQVQAACTDTDVLNGLAEYVVYSKGSGNVGWDVFSNFTFVA